MYRLVTFARVLGQWPLLSIRKFTTVIVLQVQNLLVPPFQLDANLYKCCETRLDAEMT